jgi:L-2-hydroxyglutarate oxidase LhgO
MNPLMVPERTHTLIVGAGIVGLALARELLAAGCDDILVIDKEPILGAHASGRNSGVLHAGIYYAPDTLKARICLEGNFQMKAYCKEKGLPILEKGKVIVARDTSEWPALEALFRRAKKNGAKVEMIDEQQLADIEPNAKTAGKAIYSHYTAQIDPRAVLEQIRQDLIDSGRVNIVTRCPLEMVKGSNIALTGLGEVAFEKLINAAGAHCDKIARSFDIGHRYRMIPFKGIYRKLRKSAPYTVNGNIYPVPDIRNPFLGVHFTRGIHGDVYLGPTAIPAFGRENYGILKGIDGEGWSILLSDAILFGMNPKFRSVALSEPRKYVFSYFFEDARKLVKALSPDHVESCDKVGIRSQLVDWRTKELVMDFLVEASGDAVHILNPVSPAFTCSMALARHVVQQYF